MQYLQPNTTLQGGKYRIERVLGQGGFGITYLAEQVSLGRKVAIKEFFMKDYCVRQHVSKGWFWWSSRESTIVAAQSTGSGLFVEQYRKKFIKEARNLFRLNHPHIIKVLDVFEENGTVYYVMPYFSGGSLQDYVESHGTLSEDETMKYIRQIASALKYMHEDEHICHYDVKPANILLDNKGNAVLIDFGISKNYDTSGHETSTTPVGLSEGYAPIEQYQHNVEEFSPSSDVYALGATLYTLLHGKPPVSAANRASGIPLMMFKSLSQEVKDIINASMKVSRRERAQSMEVFLDTPDRQYNLGIGYYYGDGVPQNYAEAVKCFRKAAEKGNANAQFYLGVCFDNGKGVPQDYSEAVKWYRKAAEQGDADAQCNLGVCYENGDGVPLDYSEAVKWYRKAAEQGNANAQYNLGVCYANGKGVPQNYSEAAKWYRKAAEQGNANAQNNLGVCYENGNGVRQDYSEAVKWYRKAAEQGNANAQYNLGVCYENGNGVPQDYSEAVKWYKKAAEQGDADAQYKLGVCYEGGFGVPQNYSKAAKWYRKAAEQGHADAQDGLRYCNEHMPLIAGPGYVIPPEKL